MFGYVRPEKSLLRIRDYALFRSVYCGLCKSLGKRYGQIPRFAVTYDMTFFSIVLMAFAPEEPIIREESCVLNPVTKNPVAVDNDLIDFAADLSCLLAYEAAQDNAIDDKPVLGKAEMLFLSRAHKEAQRRLPDAERRIHTSIAAIQALEKGDPTFEAASLFGDLMAALTAMGFDKVAELWRRSAGEQGAKAPSDSGERSVPSRSEDEAEARLEEVTPFSPDDDTGEVASFYTYMIGEAMRALGRWVYLIDAVDDLEEDRKKGNWNPFLPFSDAEFREEALRRLQETEDAVDRGFALLRYPRMGPLVYNVVVHGLPNTRKRVLAGEALPQV